MEQNKLEEVTTNVNAYLKTNIEIIKLELVEQASNIGSRLIANFLVLTVAFLFILFISLSAGFYLSNYFGNNYLGFMAVAGFYFIIGLVLLFGKKYLIENPMREKIISKAFSDN